MIAQAEAELAATEAEVARTKYDVDRYRSLAQDHFASLQRFQQADADYKKALAADADRARAALEAAQRQLDVIDTQKQQTEAALAEADAERDLAQLNLGYTELRAPIDGTVGNRSARAGAYRHGRRPAHRRSCRRTASGSMPTSRRASSPACAPGMPVTVAADVLPGEVFHGHVASLAPATGAQFSVLPPENATGNFTKIVQRVPVRILLDGDAADARPAAARPVGHRRRSTSEARREHAERPAAAGRDAAPRPASCSPTAKVFAFASMCVGFFIALLDIQIVSASLRDIGGGLSAGPDEIAWVQTSYLIAEIVVIPLSGWLSRVMSTRWLFCASAVGLHRHQPAVRLGLEHPEHDRVPRAAGLPRRLDDPDRVHHRLHLSSQASSG